MAAMLPSEIASCPLVWSYCAYEVQPSTQVWRLLPDSCLEYLGALVGRLFEAARNPIHAHRALFRMNATEYKSLHEKIRRGRTTSEERRIYWSYVSLLLDDIKEAYCSTHNRLRCTNAEIRNDYQGGRYIYAKYATAYWSLEAVVGHSDITIVACSFIDPDDDTELIIANGLGMLLLDGTSFTLPNFRPWSMDAVLYLAAKGVCICERCLYPYELCHHHEADKKAILSL